MESILKAGLEKYHFLNEKKKDLTHSSLPLLGHGKCDCGKCKCDEGWYGEACQYPTTCNLTRKKSNEMCKNSQDIICSGAGKMFFIAFDGLMLFLCYLENHCSFFSN